MSVKSFLLIGVGGQGTVLAGNVLCSAAMHAGFDVKKSEIHGMAQRGGSVVAHVRYGEEVFSPVIPEGGADYIVSYEQMEFLRYLSMCNKNTALLLNTKRIFPLSVALGADPYPEETVLREKSKFAVVDEFDAAELAAKAGNIKAVSIVMLGRLAKYLPDIPQESWEAAIEDNVPAKNRDVNFSAFRMAKN